METQQSFVQIIVPVPVKGTFTYKVPQPLLGKLSVGQRVTVPFGAKKLYTGIVVSLTDDAPDGYKLKEVIDLVDDQPVVTLNQINFWFWIAEYYMCSVGDVYRAAVPVALRPDSESFVLPIDDDNSILDHCTDIEKQIHALLVEEKSMSMAELCKQFGNVAMRHVKQLADNGLAIVSEEVSGGYKTKKLKVVSLSKKISNRQTLERLLVLLVKSKKQQELLLWMVAKLGDAAFDGKYLSRQQLIDEAQASPTIIKGLIEKGILSESLVDVSRIEMQNVVAGELKQLNQHQTEALSEINQLFEKQTPVLLHGITGSGKTEIYIHLIDQTIKAGKRVLYLLPEIALTTQIVRRLRTVFGSKVGVYHSKFSGAERVEIWNNMLRNDEQTYPILLGVRSSIFLPISNLGLIIVDEEHESSFKQFSPAPRYNARDLAVLQARQLKANIVMGSATPSLESFYNTTIGRYGLVKLNKRHGAAVLPQVYTVNLMNARKQNMMVEFFSHKLLAYIDAALKKGDQVILFQNRRGYSPFLECKQCATIPKCKSCDVSLTYHKSIHSLVCHYCGYTTRANMVCQCGGEMHEAGFGTERVEDELQKIFPKARIARLDTDTTRTKHGGEHIVNDFQDQKIDILIGTQMVSKGLDFEHVSVVGILNADNMLGLPDFRAYERGFQLMMQVSGRAGRKDKQGVVIIQTNDPENHIIRQVVDNNYYVMFDEQMAERKNFCYPPYYRLIDINIKHRDKQKVSQASSILASQLRRIQNLTVLGPCEPPISRIQNFYLMNILVKLTVSDVIGVKRIISQTIDNLLQTPEFKSVIISANVDPM